MPNKFLYENKYYVVLVGKIPSGEMKDQDCYTIVNKDTLIVESCTFVLPEAIHTADNYSEALTEVLHKTEDSLSLDTLPPLH